MAKDKKSENLLSNLEDKSGIVNATEGYLYALVVAVGGSALRSYTFPKGC